MKAMLPLFIAAALGCTPAARAGSLIDVGVVDRDTGTTLPAYPRDGKFYVVGVPGHRYGVRLTNRSGGRVLAVLSVDGVNAVSGQTANPDQTGYVLDAWQSTEVDGWRKSMNEVAQFNFTALSSSYAARTGRPDNVGVIGVAVFREKPPVTVWRGDRAPPIAQAARDSAQAPAASTPIPSPPSGAADTARAEAAPASRAADGLAAAGSFDKRRAQPEESLGTGHGAREWSNVSYTNFERAGSRPDEVVSVWYDSWHNLAARGIVPPPLPVSREPQPFPNAFVPDPAG